MRRPSLFVSNVPSVLSASERTTLFNPSTGHDEAARRYSFAFDELALANGKCRERNPRGSAVQLMLVRGLGRTLRVGEELSPALVDVFADQLGIDTDAFDLYGARDETRREHALEIADLIGLRTIAQRDYRAVIAAAVLTAAATERGAPIVTAVLVDPKERGILVWAPALIGRFALADRAQARRHATGNPAGKSTTRPEKA